MTKTIKIKKIRGKFYQPFKHSYMRVVKTAEVKAALAKTVREFLLSEEDTPKVTPEEFYIIMNYIDSRWIALANTVGQSRNPLTNLHILIPLEKVFDVCFLFMNLTLVCPSDVNNFDIKIINSLREVIRQFFSDNKDYHIDTHELHLWMKECVKD